MTTVRTYICNVCRSKIENNSGVGFSFKSGNTEFEYGHLIQHENHLCKKCIQAIWDMSNKMKTLGEI